MQTIDRTYVIELLQTLVSINSVNPSLVPGAPGEGEVARYLAGVCAQSGLHTHLQEVAPGRSNVIATLPGTGGGHRMLLNGHIDTVAVTGMDHPFEPVIRAGRLFGRGAYDMKGSIAAMVGAIHAIQAGAARPAGDIVLTCVVDEEYASLGTEALVGKIDADAAIVTEPTDLEVCVAHKGFAWVRFETTGRAAHGSRYDEGHDAIAAMGRILMVLSHLESEVYPRRTHPLLGRASVHASTVVGGEGLSTYPPTCRLEIERRTLPEETVEDVTAEMADVVRQAAPDGAVLDATSTVFFFRPGYEIAPDAALVKTLVQAAERVLGRSPRVIGSWPWMDSAILGRAGLPTVIFGPTGAGAHSVEEYVDLDSVIHCAAVLAEAIVAFCGTDMKT